MSRRPGSPAVTACWLAALVAFAAARPAAAAPADAASPPAAGAQDELVLIHGLGASAAVWDEVRPYLAGSMRVHAYELHGHGATRPLPSATITAEAAALGEWLRANDVSYPTLVGHGLGGMIALQFALDHPVAVRRVILIDAAPRQLATADEKARVRQALLDDYDRFVASQYLASSEDDEISRRAVDQALRTDSTTFASLLLSSFEWDVSGRLASFPVPMLVIASENFLPEPGQERATLEAYGFAAARTLHFKKVSGAGHHVMLEQPTALASMIMVYARLEPAD